MQKPGMANISQSNPGSGLYRECLTRVVPIFSYKQEMNRITLRKPIAVLLVALPLLLCAGCGSDSAGNPNPPPPGQNLKDLQNNPNVPPQAKAAAESVTSQMSGAQKSGVKH